MPHKGNYGGKKPTKVMKQKAKGMHKDDMSEMKFENFSKVKDKAMKRMMKKK